MAPSDRKASRPGMPPPGDYTRAARNRVGRAPKACVFCKQRKIKCTGDLPQCKNCEIYHKECVYITERRKTRPTNAALEQLREENRALRRHAAFCGGLVSRENSDPSLWNNDPDPSHTDVAEPQNRHVRALPANRPTDEVIDSSSVSKSWSSINHGPTSTLFEDGAHQQDQPWLSSRREAWTPKLLLAAAAEQRHMESINARAGKLDFDGVDPELGLHLLNLHWNRQHHAHLATYRPAFMRDMACNGPYFSKILLNAIYYGAAKFSPRIDIRKDPDDVRTAGLRFRDRVGELLGPALNRSEITTIQALLQMTNSLFALGNAQSAAWVYAGTAFRMLNDLGLHVDASTMPNMKNLTDEDIEIRRRVFWSAFVIDKMQSLYQGRPATLQPADCQVPIKFLDMYEELEHWQPFAYNIDTIYAGSASYSVSTFTELCKLCIILTDVLNRIYREERTNRPSEALIEDLKSLEMKIQNWKAMLPLHLNVDLSESTEASEIAPPHVLSLLAMWNVLRVLLHRPFVSDGHLHSTSPSTAISSFVACAEAATNIIRLVRLYDRAFSIKRAPYLISYATYVAATIHVRIAAKQRSASEAHESLKICLAVFDQNAATNWAVRKASMVIKNLIERMGVSMGTNNSPSHIDNDGSRIASADIQDPKVNDITTQKMMQQQNKAQSDTEPTLVAGGFAPGLNVDAIIQSFTQEQQMGGNRTTPLSTNSLRARPSDQSFGEASQLQWNEDYVGPNFNFDGVCNIDDALFGFDTSDFDWHYSQSGPS